MNIFFIFLFLIFLLQHDDLVDTQSTCPVVIQSSDIQQLSSQQQQQQPQRCKCGIKTDGHIYIFCARRMLKRVPKFLRSSILYDELILSGNLIEHVANNSFQGIRVKHLYLDDNRIQTIEQGAFAELANYLEELVLDIDTTSQEDSTTSLQLTPPMSIFDNLLNLKQLKLNGFIHMFKIGPFLFNKTRKLETIYLSNCNLIEIATNAFSGIELSLKELNLNHNQLNNEENLSGNLFKLIYSGYFKRLEVLNLAYNRIKSLVDTTDEFEYVHDDTGSLSLDLSFNEISYIDEMLFNKLRFKLSKLNLNNNELTNESGDNEDTRKNLNFVKHLINLRELHLDYNHIKFLNKNLFRNLEKLEILSLKGNFIHSLNSFEIFTGLNLNLRKLNLASNKLEYLQEGVFQNLSKLKELNLEKNSLATSLNSAEIFAGLQDELKMLNLEANALGDANLETIRNLVNMEILKLGNNNLSRLDAAIFRQFVNLTSVDLDFNSFKRIPLITNKTLTSLSLMSNKICYFDIEQLMAYYKQIKNLNLNSNQLQCDCRMRNLRVWLESSRLNSTIELFMLQNLRCSGPLRHRGKLIMSMDAAEFVCDERDGTNSECDDVASSTTLTTTPRTTTTIIETTVGAQVVQAKQFIKHFNVYFLTANSLILKWQVEGDAKVDDDQQFQSKIRYFKLIINELNMPATSAGAVNTTILSSNMKLIHSNMREYRVLNVLNENKVYELCLLLVYDIQEYEKSCQIINTKQQEDEAVPVTTVSTDFYRQTGASTAPPASSSGDWFKFETKQILFGSLIGALIVIILILIIIYLLKISKTSVNEKKLLYEQQQQQQRQQKPPTPNNMLMPLDYNTLRANILDYGVTNGQNQQILFIRPVATLPNYSKKAKKSKLSSFLSRFNSSKEEPTVDQQTNVLAHTLASASGTPFLLSDFGQMFPSYVIKQAAQNQHHHQHDTTTTSSSSSSSSTSSAFGGASSFTPILSTTLETLTNNSDVNNSNNYQHMYHEITDTLLSSKSKYLLNHCGGGTITNLSPYLPAKLTNQQYLISNEGFYENHAKEMFI